MMDKRSISTSLLFFTLGNRIWHGASSPSPRLPSGRLRSSSTGYGEGRGEGASPQAQPRGEAPSPAPILSSVARGGGKDGGDLSPQAGGGESPRRMRFPFPQSSGDQNGGGRWLELTVRDDGFGIATGQTQGFGLRGMQERVQALGGDFTVETERGLGTCVRIVIPLPSPSNGSARAADYVSNAR